MPSPSAEDALRYIRAKVDQLLTVMGTLPLRPEELDDETLIQLDPIGIIAESFQQVIDHLTKINQKLDLATSEIRSILESLGAAIVVLNREGCIEECNRLALDWLFGGADRSAVVGNPVGGPGINLPGALSAFHAPLDVASSGTVRLGERDIQFVATKILDSDSHHAKTAILFTDVTERERIEALLRSSETRYRNLIQDLPLGIVITQDGLIKYVNSALADMIGYSIEELAEKPFLPFVAEADRPWLLDLHRRRMNGEAVAPMYVVGMVHKNGTVRQWQGRINTIEWNGKLSGLGSFTDITERQKAEETLRIAAVAFESQEGMMITDASRVILQVNRTFTEITGYTAAEAVGRTPDFLRSDPHDRAFSSEISASVARAGFWQGEIWGKRKDGEIYPKWLTITAVKDAAGVITHYVDTETDISTRKAAEEEIAHLAFYDTLTKLPNRRLLLERLQQALISSTRSRRYCSLFLLDLDNFKTLNDTLGHDMGDLLLQQVGARLCACVREGDTVARLGGDEFVVLLEGLSEGSEEAVTQAEVLCEKIVDVLAGPFELPGREHLSTLSIGITLFCGDHNSVEELLKQADLAMYQAKASGRNIARFFDPEMQAMVHARAALELQLREAVTRQQFVVYYQPQMIDEGHITGAEALIRWQHPQRGLVPPAEFISLAEETGLILSMGLWVMEEVCTQLARWSMQPDMAHLTLAVNICAKQLHQPNFVDQVLAILTRTGANPSRLKLELTESQLVSNVEISIAKMTALQSHGVTFSMDDFGTGYSSLAALKQLPLSQLKIDMSFVRDILIDSNDAAIAKMIIALGESLGLTVIAEGVETEGQRELLARLGCSSYQGYLFSHPLPLDEFESFVKRI